MKQFSTYLAVAKNTWSETMTYRLNFTVWRLRVVLNLLITYFLWIAILPVGKTLFGYSQTLMVTYILGTAFIGSLVTSSRSASIGDQIVSGELSNFLVRPFNYFFYWFARDAGDKAINVAFALCEFSLIFLLLRPPLFLQTNVFSLVIFSLAVLLAIGIFFTFNMLTGIAGFWVEETWSLRFLIFIIIQFLAGGLFPLDILPKPLATLFSFLPFPYLLYFPMKIYLGQLSFPQIFFGLGVSLVWLILLWQVAMVFWRIGLKNYSAQGR